MRWFLNWVFRVIRFLFERDEPRFKGSCSLTVCVLLAFVVVVVWFAVLVLAM